MNTKMRNVLISLSYLLLAGTAVAGHHGEGASTDKAVIGYDTTSGKKSTLYAGSLNTVEIWSNYMKRMTIATLTLFVRLMQMVLLPPPPTAA